MDDKEKQTWWREKAADINSRSTENFDLMRAYSKLIEAQEFLGRPVDPMDRHRLSECEDRVMALRREARALIKERESE